MPIAEEEVELEGVDNEGLAAEGEAESRALSDLASVRLKRFVGFKVERDLDLRLEKRGEFGVVDAGEDLKEHLLADRAPPGAWLSTNILFPTCSAIFYPTKLFYPIEYNFSFKKIIRTGIVIAQIYYSVFFSIKV